MEELVKSFSDYASALIVKRWVELIVLAVMLILWRWWMGHKLRDRISALEARDVWPGISQVITVHGDVNVQNYADQLRSAIEEEDDPEPYGDAQESSSNAAWRWPYLRPVARWHEYRVDG